MENVTLGQIYGVLFFIVQFVGVIITIVVAMKKSMKKPLETINNTIDAKLKPIKKEIEDLKEKTNTNNLESVKTDLVNLMELADKEIISIEQKIRAYELYDYYCNHGGNSYIHDKWEKLKKEGKL